MVPLHLLLLLLSGVVPVGNTLLPAADDPAHHAPGSPPGDCHSEASCNKTCGASMTKCAGGSVYYCCGAPGCGGIYACPTNAGLTGCACNAPPPPAGVAAVSLTVDFGGPSRAARQVASGVLLSLNASAPKSSVVTPLKLKNHRGDWDDTEADTTRLRSLGLSGSIQSVVADLWWGRGNNPPGPRGIAGGENGSDWGAWEDFVADMVKTAPPGVSFDLWNEPDAAGFSGPPQWGIANYSSYLQIWTRGYNAAKAANPNATVVGPSACCFNTNGLLKPNAKWMRQFLTDAARLKVLPDIVSWHEWSHGSGSQIVKDVAWVRQLLATLSAPASTGISINEMVPAGQNFVPGVHACYFANLERANVDSAMHACWGEPTTGEACSAPHGDNCGQWGTCDTSPGGYCSPCRGGATLDGLLTCDGSERPRSVWWAYKAYATVGERLHNVLSSSPEHADAIAGLSADGSLVTMSIGVLGWGCPDACPGNGSTAVSLSLRGLPATLLRQGGTVDVSVAWIEDSGVQPLTAPRVVHLPPQSVAGAIHLEAVASGTAAFVVIGKGAATAVAAFVSDDWESANTPSPQSTIMTSTGQQPDALSAANHNSVSLKSDDRASGRTGPTATTSATTIVTDNNSNNDSNNDHHSTATATTDGPARNGSSFPPPTSVAATATVGIEAWEFETDPHDVGVSEKWFSMQARPTLARNISSPGAWQAMGVGMLGGYVGVGWYRTQLAVPPVPPGGSVWLWIGGAPGGVLRSANVYANGVHVGRHVGYIQPLELELTPALSGTSALTLAVAVDSRWNRTEDPLWASGALGTCFSFGGCGGMIGNAQLRVRQRAWFEDSVHTTCADTGGGAWRCSVGFSLVGAVHQAADRIGLTVCEAEGEGCVSVAPAAVKRSPNGRNTLSLVIPAAKLWFPGTRQAQADLYVASLTLTGKDGQSISTMQTRFGIRSLFTDGPQIIWNGEPLFLRGYGDDGQYGFTGAPPMNKDYYTAQLAGMKALGYNYIRFHTHQMPDVFHEAADELGFLSDPEFSMCSVYPTPFAPLAVTGAVKDMFSRSFASIVHRRQHHPSLFGYVLSNEISWGGLGDPQFVELYRFAKQHDPDRPCMWTEGATTLDIDTMNISALGCRNGSNASDFHCFSDVWTPDSVWSHSGGLDPTKDIRSGVPAAELPVPMLLHEAMDARTFPRLEESLQSFDGGIVNAELVFGASVSKMRALGLLEENDRWADATEQAYTMFLKSYLEAYRLDAAVSGYEWCVVGLGTL